VWSQQQKVSINTSTWLLAGGRGGVPGAGKADSASSTAWGDLLNWAGGGGSALYGSRALPEFITACVASPISSNKCLSFFLLSDWKSRTGRLGIFSRIDGVTGRLQVFAEWDEIINGWKKCFEIRSSTLNRDCVSYHIFFFFCFLQVERSVSTQHGNKRYLT